MNAVVESKIAANSINEEVLRDVRYPVHRIADALLPYLQVLVSKFRPERVVLFGSYAYGKPTVDSDVDLLVVKPLQGSGRAEATAIRKAFQPLRRQRVNLPFNIVVRDSRDLDERLARGAMFHADITSRGGVIFLGLSEQALAVVALLV
jgi:predicted nucleotidyltransferase